MHARARTGETRANESESFIYEEYEARCFRIRQIKTRCIQHEAYSTRRHWRECGAKHGAVVKSATNRNCSNES